MSAIPECTFVLASASPRRRRLIEWLGLPVVTTSVDTPEDLDSPLSATPERLAEHLAVEKARAARTSAPTSGRQLIVAFDTIVVLDGDILGKPSDVDDAWRMLRALSGRTHQVVTGVALLAPDAEAPQSFPVSTNVRMKALGERDIRDWMASGEFMGCAGAYNIEGQVAQVDGDECYHNVAGLPLCHLAREISRIAARCGLGEIATPVTPCDAALGRHCTLGPRVLAER